MIYRWIFVIFFSLLPALALSQEEGIQAAFELSKKHHGEVGLVWHHGKIIAEDYVAPYGPDQRHRLWSISKSVLNLLIGRLANQGAISLEEKVHRTISAVPRTVTVDHLLSMSSGLAWNESYDNPFKSDVLSMLYGLDARDMGMAAANKSHLYAPYQKYKYSSGTSNILSRFAEASAKKIGLNENFAWPLLFNPLGIQTAVWERDNQGTIVGSSFLFLSPRDLLKIGQFIIQDGVWEDRRLLPEGWIAHSRKVSPGYETPQTNIPVYSIPGHHFWINKKPFGGKIWARLSDETIAALGHHGQVLVVDPTHQLIIIRLGRGPGWEPHRAQFIDLIAAEVIQ